MVNMLPKQAPKLNYLDKIKNKYLNNGSLICDVHNELNYCKNQFDNLNTELTVPIKTMKF